jgi:glycosyltransferase involved in cell wall biosynthesis
MKIGIFCPRDLTKAGGTPIRVTGLSKYVSDYCDVTIFSRGRLPEDIANKITHVPMKRFYLPPYYNLFASFFPQIINPLNILLCRYPGALQLINSDYDILQCSQHNPTFIALMLKNKIDSPILFDMNGLIKSEMKLNARYSIKTNILYPLYNKFEKKILLESDAISTSSEEMGKYITSEFGIPSEKVFTIPDGVDIELFKNIEKERIEKIRTDLGTLNKKVVMYVGHISPLHDSINLIKSFYLVNKKLKEKKTEITFVIITHGPNSTIERRYIELTQGLDNLILHPPIPHQDLPIYLKAADLLVIPYANDMFTNMVPHLKTFEYMASGTPTVATRTKGNENVLVHEKNAFLVEPENPESMAAGIVNVLENVDLAKEIGKNAEKDIDEKYSWKNSAKKAIEAYKIILARWNK